MASIKKQIGKAARDVNNAVKTGSIRALNKALTTAKSQMTKALAADTGLTQARLKNRILALKANKNKMVASVNVATKVGIPLDEFKPKVQKVPVGNRNYLGVSVKIGKGPRELVPGGFYTQVGSGKQLILQRKRNDTTRAGRFPTVRPRANVLLDSAKANAPDIAKVMKDRFDTVLQHEIDYALAQKLTPDKTGE